jgi:hypothetical protein
MASSCAASLRFSPSLSASSPGLPPASSTRWPRSRTAGSSCRPARGRGGARHRRQPLRGGSRKRQDAAPLDRAPSRRCLFLRRAQLLRQRRAQGHRREERALLRRRVLRAFGRRRAIRDEVGVRARGRGDGRAEPARSDDDPDQRGEGSRPRSSVAREGRRASEGGRSLSPALPVHQRGAGAAPRRARLHGPVPARK